MKKSENLYELLKEELNDIDADRLELMFTGFGIDERVVAKLIQPFAENVSRVDFAFSPMTKRSPGFLRHFYETELRFQNSKIPQICNRVICVRPKKAKEKYKIFHSKFLFVFSRSKKTNQRNLIRLYLGSMNWSGYHFSVNRSPEVLESFVNVDLDRTNGIEAMLSLPEFADIAPGNLKIETSGKIIRFDDDGSSIDVKILKKMPRTYTENEIEMIAAPYVTQMGVRCLIPEWKSSLNRTNFESKIKIFGASGTGGFRLHGKFVIGRNDSFLLIGSTNISGLALNGENHESQYHYGQKLNLSKLKAELSKQKVWDEIDSSDRDSDDEFPAVLNLPSDFDGLIVDAKLARVDDDLFLVATYSGDKIRSRKFSLIAGSSNTLRIGLELFRVVKKKNEISFRLSIRGKNTSNELKDLIRLGLSTQIIYLQMDDFDYLVAVDLAEFWTADYFKRGQSVSEVATSKIKTKGVKPADVSINWRGTDVRPMRIFSEVASEPFLWLMKILSEGHQQQEPTWVKKWKQDPWLV